MLYVEGLMEDEVWIQHCDPLMRGLPKNVYTICEYGFTEMLNNVIDHSGSEAVNLKIEITSKRVTMTVTDLGVGVFKKVKQTFGLKDELAAIRELSIGKLTTDAEKHSGQGIFFTSKAFDRFILGSGSWNYIHLADGNDWLLEDNKEPVEGTVVVMRLSTSTTRQLKDVFDEYCDKEEDIFSRTHVPVFLQAFEGGNLVSRSQAKRLLNRFDVFNEFTLDFDKVESIGQAFADEIFRVYQRAHPEKKFIVVRANEEVMKQIKRARALLAEQT